MTKTVWKFTLPDEWATNADVMLRGSRRCYAAHVAEAGREGLRLDACQYWRGDMGLALPYRGHRPRRRVDDPRLYRNVAGRPVCLASVWTRGYVGGEGLMNPSLFHR